MHQYPSHDSIINYFNQRVGNYHDLHTRSALATGRNVPHYHSGIRKQDDEIPTNDKDALTWLYESQQVICDLIWSLAMWVGLRKPTRILDMGCGVGGTLTRFRELSHSSTPVELAGITLSTKEQAYAQHFLPETTILAGDMMTDPRLPTNWFNLLVAVETTEYLGEKHIEPFMHRAQSLLSPQGSLVVAANSLTSTNAAQSPTVSTINTYQHTQIVKSDTYLTAADSTGLTLLGEVDLTSQTTHYWKTRYENELFQNSKDGWFERLMFEGFREELVNYKLYIWAQK